MAIEVEENKSIFLALCKQYIKRDGTNELLKFMEEKSDFFSSPASTRFHLAEEGGLCQHSLNVFNNLTNLYEMWAKQNGHEVSEKERESIAIVSLFHDICKIGCYHVSEKNVKEYSENGDKMEKDGRKFSWVTQKYYTFEDPMPFGHGEKSQYMLSGFMKLSRAESMAIRWHMGGFDKAVQGGELGINAAYSKYPLAVMLNSADMLASYLDECPEEEKN